MPALLRPLRSLLWFTWLLCAQLALAQSVRWEPASGTLAREQVNDLTLVIDGTEPTETPEPPAVPGLAFGNPRVGQNGMDININGRLIQQSSRTYTYPVRCTVPGDEVRIPAFTVQTRAGPLTAPPVSFRVAAATVGRSGLPLDKIAVTRLEAGTETVWAGQVIPLRHILSVHQNHAFDAEDRLAWETPLLVEDWSTDPARVPSGQAVTQSRETRLLAPAAGKLALGPVDQRVVIATGTDIFGRPVGNPYLLTTPPLELDVRPLPTPAPADYLGAVGRFKLTSKVVPEHAAVGEPVTWTLTLEGTGNWPSIDRLAPRSVSRDFRVITPRAQKTTQPERLFDGSLAEDLVLIPQRPGRQTLGPYAISIFNPTTGAYEKLTTPALTIDIAPAAAAATPATASAAATPNDSAATEPSREPPPPPARVAPLPADPLPAGRFVANPPLAPWPATFAWSAFALLAPLGLWLALAARHAARHDPLRARRAAHVELGRALGRLESGTADPADLLAWQRHARTLLGIDATAPAARSLPDPRWAALWAETERVLYRPATPLAAEWITEARTLHAASRPPARSPLAALRAAHLFPRAAALALAAGLLAAPTPRASAADAYQRGDFPAAEHEARAALADAPTDAGLRHNLALALAQQGRWDEAAAHAFAARLHAPAAPETERLLAVVGSRTTYRLPTPPAAAARAGLRTWQHLAFAGAAALALGLAAHLTAAYATSNPSRRINRLAGHALLLLGAAALTAGLLAVRAHGPLAHTDAALVWRTANLRAVPTDAGDQKVVAELPAGTVARVDTAFLGWRRVLLADGNTGWTRAEALVPLWQSTP